MRTFTEEEVEILIQKCREMDKPKTNFDRIKAMSLEEMACWIHGIDHYVDDSETMVNLGNETLDDNLSDIMDWLQQEVEE